MQGTVEYTEYKCIFGKFTLKSGKSPHILLGNSFKCLFFKLLLKMLPPVCKIHYRAVTKRQKESTLEGKLNGSVGL